MSASVPMLHMLCGKIGSGKSTLSLRLADAPGVVRIVEDDWLNGLYGDEMASIQDYVCCAAKLRSLMEPHVASLLKAGVSVVLDFPANTVETRRWMRGILDEAGVSHALHVLDVPDEVCLERLQARTAKGEHPFAVTKEQFQRISSHFVVPAPEEGFNVVMHGLDEVS